MSYQIKYHILFVGLITFLYVQYSFSQSYHFKQYTTEDGLPTDAIYGVIQDNKGFIWVFTERGISKFDGYQFKNFGIEDGLPSWDVFNLTEDKSGKIWIHSISPKLAYLENDSIHQVKSNQNQNILIHHVFNDSNNGGNWFLGRSMRYYVKKDTVVNLSHNSRDLNIKLTKTISRNSESLLSSFFLSRDTMITFFEKEAFIFDTKFNHIEQVPISTEWIEKYYYYTSKIGKRKQALAGGTGQYLSPNYFINVTELGVGSWNILEKKGKSILHEDVFKCEFKEGRSVVSVQSNGNYQITIEGCGFYVVDNNLTLQDKFSFNDFSHRRIFQDREGNLWLSTSNKGLFFLSAQARNTRTCLASQGNKILTVAGNEKGKIFYGTDAGGVYQIKEDKSYKVMPRTNLGTNVFGLDLSEKGDLFFGAEFNGFRYSIDHSKSINNPQRLGGLNLKLDDIIYQLPHSYPNNPFKQVKMLTFDDLNNHLWFSNGLYVFSVDFSNNVSFPTSLFQIKQAGSIMKGNNGSIWVGTSSGLMEIKNDSIIDHKHFDERLQSKIRALTIDKNGVLWVGTENYGVFGYKDNQIIDFVETKGDFILSLFVDYEGVLWVGTAEGLKQYSIQSNGQTPTLIRKYTLNDGLPSNEVNAVFVDNHFVYAGTNKGLAKIDKKFRYQDDSRPRLKVTSIKINGIASPLKEYYELSHKENNLELEFTALSFKSFGKIEYEYYLKGTENSWQKTTNQKVRYPDLNPGAYSFYLKAKDIQGIEGTLAQPIRFQVLSPWWAALWFQLLCIIGGACLVFLLYKYRIRQIKRKEAEETKINKLVAQLELKALRSQMNPHFIFNALSSIQYFTYRNDSLAASQYLAKFAKLMRSFLNHSKSRFIALKEEINFIKLYIEIEQLRFENRFEVNIEIDKNLDLFMIQIPTLLLQPYIENAINHGLFHKKSFGKLNITFQEFDYKYLLICIEDNGIGREKARELKRISSHNYKSVGMQIVKDRLDVLRITEDYNIEVEIDDLKNDFGEGIGTKVKLKIPIDK